MPAVSTADIDDMIGRYDRRTRRWYRALKPPLPLISNPSEAMLPADIAGRGRPHGPTATLLTFLLEYVKLCAPRPLRKPAYAVAGWLVWPLRYLDVWLNRQPEAHVLANSIYALVRKPR
jgi:hypothetical protein